VFISESRYRDDERIFASRNAPQLRRNFAAVQVRETDIEEDELGLQLAGPFERRASAGGVRSIVPHVEQEKKERLCRIDVVVYDEDAPRRTWLTLDLRLHA
jgi:hypothetical protein